MSIRRTQIMLDIDPDAEPLAGSVSIDGAPSRPFNSWLALGRAIEAALTTARDQTTCPTPSRPQEHA